MKQKFYQFFLSAFLYWLAAVIAGNLLHFPDKIIVLASFVPPILGLMWGLPAALGCYVGGLLIVPELQNFFFTGELGDKFFYFVKQSWIFFAAFLPYFLWHRWKIFSVKQEISMSIHTLKKFLLILFVTFIATSLLRTLTASNVELNLLAGWLGSGKSEKMTAYFAICFLNDFLIAMLFDLVIFFLLVSRKYKFLNAKVEQSELIGLSQKSRRAAVIFYSLFPLAIIYFNKFQIYGMHQLENWMQFIAECLTMIDLYLALMIYLMLRYRRSIMLEVVFLVSQTVFFSAAVLGLGVSVTVGNMVTNHADESLHAMSAICRERLERTFFCVRQAVNGMKLEALDGIESYDRLVNDADYRKKYLDDMIANGSAIAQETDGSVSFYLRLIPEIEGTLGGFSMQREEVRWEGALSKFVRRTPVDLAPYSPDDEKNVGWFYIPMRSKTATWIEPYVDPVTKFYVLSYVAPLFVEDKFIGVIGMDIDFNFIMQELRRMSIYDYGYVYIMNRNNIVLYHRDQPQGSLFQRNPDFQEMEIFLGNGMWLGIAMPLSRVHDSRNAILMHLIASIILVAMLISIISITLASKSVKPLAGMTEAAKKIASGDLNVKISYESGNELGILVRSIREMAAKLENYVYRDKLTGLRNAAAYASKAQELDAQNKLVPDLNYGVIIFDVNFLKKVNDNHGHEAGNELLRHASKVMREVFVDSPVYRIGGDEFAAVLEGVDFDNRNNLLKLFDEKIAAEYFYAGEEKVSVSVARGLGLYEPGKDFSFVSKAADVAMYNHKAAIKAFFGEDVR